MKNETKGGVPHSFEPTALVVKPNNCSNEETPSEGNTKKLTFNTCFALLGLQIQVPKQDLFCERARCVNAREKGEDTKLVMVKNWSMKSTKLGAAPTWAIMKCPRCEKRTRHYLGDGGKKK